MTGYLRRHSLDVRVDETEDKSGDQHMSNVLLLKGGLPDIKSLTLSVLTNLFAHAHQTWMQSQ